MELSGLSAQAAQDGSGPKLRSLSILPTIQLTGSGTNVSLLVGETSTVRLDEIKVQLDRPIPLILQAAQGGRGYAPLVPVTTATIDAYLPTERVVFSPNTYFFLQGDGAGFSNLTFGAAAAGVYNITSVTLIDANGNNSSYSADDLVALGVHTSFTVLADRAAPTITTLALPTITPVLGDPYNSGGALVTLHLGVADPSGENQVMGTIHLVAPDGSTVDVTVPDPSRIANAPVGFTSGYVGDARLVLTKAGTYRVSGVDAADTSGNSTHYTADDLAGLGLPTSFNVVQQGNIVDVQPYGFFALDGPTNSDGIQLNGNISDYTLSRGNIDFFSSSNSLSAVGDFVLTANNGSGAYSLGESVGAVRFQNGQYLALQDLPAYIRGSDALSIGGDQNDLLYQSRASGYEAFRGGNGDDQLFLNGNVSDYTTRAVQASFFGQSYGIQGIELISRNGSGALLIDSSVETVHFQNGQYLAFNDIGSYVAAATPDPENRVYLVAPDGFNGGSAQINVGGSSNADNVVLLDGHAADFSLSRGQNGSFILTGPGGTFSIDQGWDGVQFGDGQFLSIRDLRAYVHGDATFTTGKTLDDLLYVPLSGDHYVTGDTGTDDLYVNGNTRDYSLQSVSLAASVTHPAIHGYELVATNGSGNIYIDQSVETVHFQDGQYLAFQDLPAYVHGGGTIG